MNTDFWNKVKEITQREPVYKLDAYEFMMQALWFTQKKLKRDGHISGRELLEGIRSFALEQYGPMAKTVINYWGIEKTEDFGKIIFNMVDAGLLRKTEQDSLEDFKDVYDFNQAFDAFRIKVKKSKGKPLIRNEEKNILS